MKTQTRWMLVTIAALAANTSVAHARVTDMGNGGDICEDRIAQIRDDFAQWIQMGGSAGLTLPSGVTPADYNSKMSLAIDQAVPSCQDGPVEIGQTPKACKNFVDAQGIPRILCDRQAFMDQTSDEGQYVLIHHEYAGLAGFEVNDGDSSAYTISNQLSGYTQTVEVTKLALVPKCDHTDEFHSPVGTTCRTSVGGLFVRVDGGWKDLGENGKTWYDYKTPYAGCGPNDPKNIDCDYWPYDLAEDFCKKAGHFLPQADDFLTLINHRGREILRDLGVSRYSAPALYWARVQGGWWIFHDPKCFDFDHSWTFVDGTDWNALARCVDR